MSLDGIQARLLGTFVEENTEGLVRFETGLLELERSGTSPERIGEVFRAIHSLKGSAGSFGFTALASLAHEMETHLDRVRNGQAVADATLIRPLLGGVDLLRRLLDAAAGHGEVDPAEVAAACERVRALKPTDAKATGGAGWRVRFEPSIDLFRRGLEPLRLFAELAALGPLDVKSDASSLPTFDALDPTACFLKWTLELRADVAREAVEAIFDWVDGGWSVEPLQAPPPEEKAEAHAPVAATVSDAAGPSPSSVRVALPKLDQLMNMVGELVITQAMVGELDDDRPLDTARIQRLREGLSQLARNTRALQESVMRLRAMPLAMVLGRVPRVVHDLAAQLGKEVQLEVTGDGLELDKTVLERLGDPLIHLVRNSLDHGLETPEVREAAGKPRTGRLFISAQHRGSEVVVVVGDDGRGLDLVKIRERAVERGLIKADAELSDAATRELIFAPGLSTAKAVTDVSGRGVGMDVVLGNVRGIGGDITIDSTPGQGTRFTLRLPLTLAIIDGQLVRVGAQTFVVPLLSIVESVQPEPKLLHTIGERPVYRLRDELVPMIDLREALRLTSEPRSAEQLMVVVEADGRRVGLMVDELLAQQQVVVKSLKQNYGQVPGLADATILGDGNVSFILEISTLAQRARGARLALAA